MTTPPAGWYPQPDDPRTLRYWDGSAWTEHSRPAAGGVDEPTMPLPAMPSWGFLPPPPSPPAPWYRRWWAITIGGVLALFVAMAVLGSVIDEPIDPAATSSTANETSALPSPSSKTSEEPTPTATVTVTEEASPTGEADNAETAKPTKAPGGNMFAMPNEVGNTLQGAQDELQAVSGNPLFYSFSEDASGAGRMQVLDSGWQVCSQAPAAGKMIRPSADVTFFVVRAEESCP